MKIILQIYDVNFFKMFLEKSFQSEIVQDELRNSRVKALEDRTFVEKSIAQAKSYFKLFLQTSSIHGLNHLVADGRHLFEM